ncbi:MAG: metallophosphoesterase family protein [Candidatus Omnitrophota bacterium]|nr:metallophosphoesterase family protein [Candidatus Omnitrophota bacterium]
MRYAVFADIHSNLEAWQAVSESFKNKRIDGFICAGDIVGYGPDPQECIKLVRGMIPAPLIVGGNHDWAVAGKLDIDYFNTYAKQAILWTKENLSQVDKDYLGSLSLIQEGNNFTLVHGSLDQPEEFRYIIDIRDAEPSFRILEKDILFVAHSHVPFILSMKQEKMRYIEPGRLNLCEQEKYIINVGSIGQPRDGDPRACYLIYDAEVDLVEFERVEYDIVSTRRKIIKAGLPGKLADRLAVGG